MNARATVLTLVVLCSCNMDADRDAGLEVGADAGLPDAGLFDAGLPDAGLVDAGVPDAGLPDAGDFDEGAEASGLSHVVPVDRARAAACTAQLHTSCLYRPRVAPTVVQSIFDDEVSYLDVLGRPRKVPFAVYRAPGVTRAPLVIMSHGGANGIDRADRTLQEWATLVAGAGYVVISIAHSDYAMTSTTGPSDYDQLCAAVGVPVVQGFRCGLKVNWARPLDVAAVLGWVEARVTTNGAWRELIDLTRIAHFGHSAGAGAGMMLGGIRRNFVCAQPFGEQQGTLVPCAAAELVDRRLAPIRAIVTFSPQGPGSDGFMAESFPTLQVPMLMATGRYDGDVGEPQSRSALFPLLPPGQRWKVYLDDDGAQHGLFGGNLDPCVMHSTQLQCEELRAWLTSAALAFLDAQLRGNAAGEAWLSSGNLDALSAGVAQTEAR